MDSREGQGSTFKIILPILYSDEEPPDTNEPTDPHELQAPLQPAEPSHTPAAEAPESPNTPEPFDLQLHGLPDIHESPDSHPYGPETYEQFDPQLHELQPTEPPEIPAAKQYDQENGIQDI